MNDNPVFLPGTTVIDMNGQRWVLWGTKWIGAFEYALVFNPINGVVAVILKKQLTHENHE